MSASPTCPSTSSQWARQKSSGSWCVRLIFFVVYECITPYFSRHISRSKSLFFICMVTVSSVCFLCMSASILLITGQILFLFRQRPLFPKHCLRKGYISVLWRQPGMSTTPQSPISTTRDGTPAQVVDSCRTIKARQEVDTCPRRGQGSGHTGGGPTPRVTAPIVTRALVPHL